MCGSAIQSLEIGKIDNTYQIINNKNPLSYQKTMFDKLGFNLLSLLPVYGKPSTNFERYNMTEYGSYDSIAENQYKFCVKPVTTNSALSGSVIQSLVNNAYGFSVENTGIPSYQRQAESNGISDSLVAKNLPEKYSYPYLTIHSDIMNTSNNYLGGKDVTNQNIFSVVNRSYNSGDYTFLQDNQLIYYCLKDYTLSNFNVSIKRPDGQSIDLNTESSVIFKINKTQLISSGLKPEKKFICKKCNYKTNDKTKFNKHKQTNKHKKLNK